ncbi:AI-2E family transporter [Clostridium sp. NSJ-6]|uniref:AI-2E family transporter n=1 Tax=Clostridium hominis TaxID=2763036 RepID=A0ABR7DBR0_9CLOT|nr:AI-2E family transporter [Clostridium hominis]MBC5628308.1 AI-2E family transporter [Clostridium hominis]MDU2671001.1 AI-2E family transporter [Clostridium sp.]
MKNFLGDKFKEYWGIVTYTIIIAYVIFNFKNIISGGKNAIGIISPFIIGIAIAFILNLVMRIFEERVFKVLDSKRYSKYSSLKRPLSVALTFVVVFAAITGLIIFIIPQLIDSISTLTDTVPSYIRSFEELISQYVSNTEVLNTLWNNFLSAWREILQFTGQIVVTSLSGVVNITVGFTSGLVNFILSLIFSIYMLLNKERLQLGMKKVLYAFSKNNFADKIMYLGKVANESFSSYIGGQFIEAIIIGALCFIGMIILKMPYPLLISVLVAVTALIPIFGAFIGTIPSAFIILIIDPMKALWFVIFIIVLQQIEGNLIYPKVVGSSVGLPPIWVMLAMLIGGNTFGLLGMLLGIPTFSVIYKISREYINKRLKNKNIVVN